MYFFFFFGLSGIWKNKVFSHVYCSSIRDLYERHPVWWLWGLLGSIWGTFQMNKTIPLTKKQTKKQADYLIVNSKINRSYNPIFISLVWKLELLFGKSWKSIFLINRGQLYTNLLCYILPINTEICTKSVITVVKCQKKKKKLNRTILTDECHWFLATLYTQL